MRTARSPAAGTGEGHAAGLATRVASPRGARRTAAFTSGISGATTSIALAAHPGLSSTDLQANSVEQTGSRVESLLYGLTMDRLTMDRLAMTTRQGARPRLRARPWDACEDLTGVAFLSER